MLIDVSGSLSGHRAAAIDSIPTLIGGNRDEQELKITRFGSANKTWDRGWVFPGPEDLKAAKAFVENPKPQNTRVLQALLEATQEKGEKITVVLVSDGEFIEEKDQLIVNAVAASKHPVLIYGIGNTNDSLLKTLGQFGGGYYKP